MLAPDEKQAGKLPQGVDELLKTMSKSAASLVTAQTCWCGSKNGFVDWVSGKQQRPSV
jgi:hypothetical protein